MRIAANPELRWTRRTGPGVRLLFVVAGVGLGLSACDQMITPGKTQVIKNADARAAEGDFLQAVNLYETALDGSADSAEIHYRLALLYDDKLKEPLHALHHFRRYLALAPAGSKADEVKGFMKRDELALVTTMSGDSIVTRGEAARLRNENLALRKELSERSGAQGGPALGAKAQDRESRSSMRSPSPKPSRGPARSHVVEPGDTLFSLSRKYYNSPDRWKEIRAANRQHVDDPGKLKVGLKLVIP